MPDIVSFPKLGLEFSIDPILAHIGPITIHWYGAIIALAFLVGAAILSKLSRKVGINSDRSFDVLMFSFVGGIICARLYYVAFSWDLYKDNLSSIFRIWEGGLAIYGGIIGGILTGLLFCHIFKVRALPMLDAASLGLMMGQAIGRWGNFFNMEAFGCNTTGLLGMTSQSIQAYLTRMAPILADQGIVVFPKNPVHPTFLYESVWNLVGFFLLLLILMPRRKFDGQVFLGYTCWYGLGRFWIEGLRTDSLMWGNVRVSQALAGVAAVVSLLLMIIFLVRAKQGKTRPLYCTTEESALAVSGELYRKKKKGKAPAAEASAEDAGLSAEETPAEPFAEVPAEAPETEAPETEAPASQPEAQEPVPESKEDL